MVRIVLLVERVAGVLLLTIALTTFVTVILRKFFGYAPPDSFDLARLLLGITIFWGIASACYRNGHILVDVFWDWCGPAGKRRIDIAATSLLLVFLLPLTWQFIGAVGDTRRANVLTFELHLPIWPWHAVAAVGIAAACLMTALRLWSLLRDIPSVVTPREARD